MDTPHAAATAAVPAATTGSMPWALQTQALTRRFGEHVVVDHLELSVAEGEVFGLLGCNSAGKSTLIKMLTTLLPPSSGSACVQGLDVVRDATAVRAANSRGTIRRLEIAQSMLHRPRMLFLDEPTAGLDPVAGNTVWEHIRELRATLHTTIFMTTHYMEEAQVLCSRFGSLRAGRLVACGSLAEPSTLHAATLDELFAHDTGEPAEAAGAYGETAQARQASQRLA